MDQLVSVDGMTRLQAAIHTAAKVAEENGDYATAAELDDISADLAARIRPTADPAPLHPTVGDP
jgi:hypothetical protein